MQTWLRVAELIKAQDFKGGFVVRSIANLPFLLHVGQEVRFVPPQLETPRSSRVSYISERPKGDYFVKFEGIDNEDAAQRLLGCFCLVDRQEAERGMADANNCSFLQYQVEDKTEGFVGEVAGLIENPAQSLLRIRAGEQELLVPFVDEIIKDIDHSEKKIYTDLPKGLIELGSNTPKDR